MENAPKREPSDSEIALFNSVDGVFRTYAGVAEARIDAAEITLETLESSRPTHHFLSGVWMGSDTDRFTVSLLRQFPSEAGHTLIFFDEGHVEFTRALAHVRPNGCFAVDNDEAPIDDRFVILLKDLVERTEWSSECSSDFADFYEEVDKRYSL